MSGRLSALAVAIFAIALVLAQLVVPETALYHTWQYALALAIALIVIVVYANRARRGADGVVGKRLALAMVGAAAIDLAGLASGLLGPDTATIVGTPGTVDPIPALGAAAFFSPADAQAIAHGDVGVTLRRRGAAEIALRDRGRAVLGESLVYLTSRPAAYIDASDAPGEHLTVTQPTNPSFLSPVLLFREQQRIGAVSVPLDTFATPAQHRIFRALYLTPRDLAAFRHAPSDLSGPGLVLTAADDTGHPLGIALAHSGVPTELGGVRVQPTLGTYPALAIASAPEPWALVLGGLFFIGGIVWAASAALRVTLSSSKGGVSLSLSKGDTEDVSATRRPT